MKFWALVGLGPNDVEITSLIFSSEEKALKYLKPILGEPELRTRDPWDKTCTQEVPFWEVNFEKGYDREKGEWSEESRNFRKTFYTKYYGGCGECWGFLLIPAEEGKPFVCFDLD